MFLMLTLPAALDAAGLLKRAIQRKVAFVPGEDFHLDGQGANTLRLNFTNAGPALLEEGVRRLAEAYYACVEDGSSYVWSRRI